MAWFGRGRKQEQGTSGDASQAATAFWEWWNTEGRAACTTALTDGDPMRVTQELTAQVHAVHPGLAWELAAGRDAAYALVVTAEGNPMLRPAARRWLRAAPEADPVWSFADFRQANNDVEGVELTVGDQSIGLGAVQVAARVDGNRIDVSLHHPAFAELPDDLRQQVAFLTLDTTIGEQAVETWIGEITASPVPVIDGFPLVHLQGLVADHEQQRRTPEGEPVWAMLEGEGPEGPILAMAQIPLAPTTAPHLDEYVAVTVPYTDQTERGMPGVGSLDRLRDLEDHLRERLGDAGRIVAHQTSAGVRVLHVYVDSTGPGSDVVEAAVRGWDQGEVEVMGGIDPGWDAVAHLRS